MSNTIYTHGDLEAMSLYPNDIPCCSNTPVDPSDFGDRVIALAGRIQRQRAQMIASLTIAATEQQKATLP